MCQSHTGHMTELWFLPTRPLRLSTNEWMCSCILALVIRHANLISFAHHYCPMWPVWIYLIWPPCLISRKIFGRMLCNIRCVLICSTTFFWIIYHSKKNSTIFIANVQSLYIKYSLFLLCCNETSICSTDFRKILKHKIFVKIRPVGAELFHGTDRRG